MRLNEYLKRTPEDEKLYSFLDNIKRDCKPYLNDLRKIPGFLLRGIRKSDPYGKKTVRQDRLPRDTPKYIHEELDDLFLKYHGWRARSQGLFAFAEKSKASTYGKSNYIFPIGNYKYLWSPKVSDLYLMVDNFLEPFDFFGREIKFVPFNFFSDKTSPFFIKFHRDLNDLIGEYGEDRIIKELKDVSKEKVIDIIKSYRNTQLDRYLLTFFKNEIMIKCKEYYYISEIYPNHESYLFQ